MIRNLTTTLSLILCLYGCADRELIEEQTIIHDPQQQKEFIVMLNNNKIQHRIDENGYITYPANQSNKVKSLLMQYFRNDLVPGRHVTFYQEFAQNLFINELKKNNIPYTTKIRDKKTWFIWDEQYSKEVKKIKEFVMLENVKEIERVANKK